MGFGGRLILTRGPIESSSLMNRHNVGGSTGYFSISAIWEAGCNRGQSGELEVTERVKNQSPLKTQEINVDDRAPR